MKSPQSSEFVKEFEKRIFLTLNSLSYEIPSDVTFWSNARLYAKITERNVCDIPNIRNLGEPLPFAWCVLLERQSLNRAKLIAIGKGHLDFRLAKVNHGDIFLCPEVFFYLNHTYILNQFCDNCKLFLLHYSTFVCALLHDFTKPTRVAEVADDKVKDLGTSPTANFCKLSALDCAKHNKQTAETVENDIVFFNLNHTYTIAQKAEKVKFFFHFFSLFLLCNLLPFKDLRRRGDAAGA